MRRRAVTYWHIELPAHDAVLAEGLACESFLDTGQKPAFEGGPALTLHPDFQARAREAAAFAPMVVVGPALDAARDRLHATAGQRAA